MTPLFTWAGGKRKMVKFYQPLFPKSFKHYVEPFFGGGAVFCQLPASSITINDINWEIMDLYKFIKHSPCDLVFLVKKYESEFLPLGKPQRKSFYYGMREKYWTAERGSIEASALLFFLLRTCFNGIWQACVASNGRFGTPAGLLNATSLLDESLILSWSEKLAKTKIMCGDYKNVKVPKGSFVFCDPPYRDSFADYNTAFLDDNQRELIDWARHTALTTGSVVWVSNRDCGDGFWENLAKDAAIHKFPVTYTAGRRLHITSELGTTFSAKKAEEVLLVFGG